MNEQTINEVVKNVMDDFLMCESINEMIDESLGIARIVENATYSILNTIEKLLPSQPMIRYDNLGLRLKELYFDYKLSNTTIQISLSVLYFKNKEDFAQKEKVVDHYFKNVSDVTNCTIRIYGIAINGCLDTVQLASTIQHEIKHHYDEIMGMKSPSKDVSNYNIATDILKGKCSNIEDAIANIIYFANKYETSAFANGLYASLVQMADERQQKKEYPISDKELISIVKSSEAYQYSLDMDRYINVLNNAKDSKELDDLLKKYQITFDNIVKLATYGKRNGLKQIGRAITLYRQNQMKNITITNPKNIPAYYHISPFGER